MSSSGNAPHAKTIANKRGRPRKFSQKQTIEAAMQLFWTQGYEMTSLGDLCEATSLPKPSLYHAFGDKEGLFVAAIQHYMATIVAPEKTALQSGQLEEALQLTALRLSRPDYPAGCLLGKALTEIRQFSPEVQALLKEMMCAIEKAFAHYLSPARARLVVTVIVGMGTLSRINKDPAFYQDVLDELMVLTGLGKLDSDGKSA